MRRLSSLPLQIALAVMFAAVVGAGFALLPATSPNPAPAPVWADATDEEPVTARASSSPAAQPRASRSPSPADAGPRALFSHTCGMCHAMRAARSGGMFGPDLDEVRPSAARVRRMIRTGSLDGVMQPELLRGEDARRVAKYVARVTGSRRGA